MIDMQTTIAKLDNLEVRRTHTKSNINYEVIVWHTDKSCYSIGAILRSSDGGWFFCSNRQRIFDASVNWNGLGFILHEAFKTIEDGA